MAYYFSLSVVALLSCLAFAARVDDDSSDAEAKSPEAALSDTATARAQAAQDAEVGASLAKYNGILHPDDLPIIPKVDLELTKEQSEQEVYETRLLDESKQVDQQLAANKAVVTAAAAAVAQQKLQAAHEETEEQKRIQLQARSKAFHADYELEWIDRQADAAQEAKTEGEVVRRLMKKSVDDKEAAMSHAKMQASEAFDRANKSGEAADILGEKRDHTMAMSIMAQQRAIAAAEADKKVNREFASACQEAHIATATQAHLLPIVAETAFKREQNLEYLNFAQDNEVSLQTQRAELLKSRGVQGDERSLRTSMTELMKKEALKAAAAEKAAAAGS